MQAQRFKALQDSPELRQARFAADAWCAAFLQHKTADRPPITQRVLTTPIDQLDPDVVAEVDTIAGRHRLFHWHLEFPDIFTVPTGGAPDTPTGWTGGFTTVIGNPPWERVKLQEQEFFASRDPEIADADNAAKRKKAIAGLAEHNPDCWPSSRPLSAWPRPRAASCARPVDTR